MSCARVFLSNRVPDEGTIGSEQTRLLGKLASVSQEILLK